MELLRDRPGRPARRTGFLNTRWKPNILWPHGDMDRAATAAARRPPTSRRHRVAGERATSQARSTPSAADQELPLFEQLLTSPARHQPHRGIAALVRDAGTLPGLEAARASRSKSRDERVTAAEAVLEPATARPSRTTDDATRGRGDDLAGIPGQSDRSQRSQVVSTRP